MRSLYGKECREAKDEDGESDVVTVVLFLCREETEVVHGIR